MRWAGGWIGCAGHAVGLVLVASAMSAGCTDGGRRLDGAVTGDGGTPGTIKPDGAEEEGGTNPAVCDEFAVELGLVIPDLLIVLDRSLSMSGEEHWDPVRDAIYAVTEELEQKISFGLMVFPEAQGDDACASTNNACEPGHDPLVACALHNGNEIREALEDLHTCGGTPTAETLVAAQAAFSITIDPRRFPPTNEVPSYVLVATDGAPNCNADVDGDTCRCTVLAGGCDEYPESCLDDVATLEAIDGLRSRGVKVFVLGITASGWRGVLDAMAERGGTGQAFMAEDHLSIQTGLEEIVGSVSTCQFYVDEPSVLADPGLVNFYLDNHRIPMDRDAVCDFGWRWVVGATQRRVLFCGPHCDAILDGEIREVRATFGCPTLI